MRTDYMESQFTRAKGQRLDKTDDGSMRGQDYSRSQQEFSMSQLSPNTMSE